MEPAIINFLVVILGFWIWMKYTLCIILMKFFSNLPAVIRDNNYANIFIKKYLVAIAKVFYIYNFHCSRWCSFSQRKLFSLRISLTLDKWILSNSDWVPRWSYYISKISKFEVLFVQSRHYLLNNAFISTK